MKNFKLILLIVIFIFCGYKILEKNKQKDNAKEIISAKIEKVLCQPKYMLTGRRNTISSKLRVNFNFKEYHVIISRLACKEVKEGDSINLYYSEKDDVLFFNNEVKQN